MPASGRKLSVTRLAALAQEIRLAGKPIEELPAPDRRVIRAWPVEPSHLIKEAAVFFPVGFPECSRVFKHVDMRRFFLYYMIHQ